jgi:hypothetical protein
VKRLVLLAVGAILFLGAVAIGAVLLLTDSPPGEASPSGPAPATAPGPTSVAASNVPAPPGPPQPLAPIPLPPPIVLAPGVKPLALPPGRVATQLQPALAPCYEYHQAGGTEPTLLAVELESKEGGWLEVVGTEIRSRGGASDSLVDCARRNLRGRRVTLGGYASGSRFVTEFGLEPPAPNVAPPREPPPGVPPKPAVGRGKPGG